jgi:hypothetical protein
LIWSRYKKFWESFKSFRVHVIGILKEKGDIKAIDKYYDMITEALTYCDFIKKNWKHKNECTTETF